MIRPECCI